MEEKKITLEKTLDTKQVASFLRLLADELEGKSSFEGNEFGWQLHGFNKLKIGLIKKEGGHLSLRLKIKDSGTAPPAPPSEFTDIAEQEYRPFKQIIKSTFALLTSCANQGRLPSPELLVNFMDQSRKLIAFKDFGDIYYDEYWQTCQAMEHEVNKGVLTGFQEKLAAITDLKKSCHHRFK
ncbi:MAG: GAK system XXXCH domain-containing protein [Proteobacteria bacterium]|nr:GAK system XXXCH domain-containing protein [Desulfobulbaceae bacterium]MBU4154104.1 GAK system XXXCH domain-containing protein [Pseudomonadota bacterium]